MSIEDVAIFLPEELDRYREGENSKTALVKNARHRVLLRDGKTVDEPPCQHAVVLSERSYPSSNYPKARERTYNIPRVIRAHYDGGYCSTMVCLDCLLLALKGNGEPLC